MCGGTSGLGVATLPDGAPDLKVWRDRGPRIRLAVKVDVVPPQRSECFGASASKKRHDNVVVQPVRCRGGEHRIDLIGGKRLRRRPARPWGISVRSTILRRTRSRAIARLTARLRMLRNSCSVRVLSVARRAVDRCA